MTTATVPEIVCTNTLETDQWGEPTRVRVVIKDGEDSSLSILFILRVINPEDYLDVMELDRAADNRNLFDDFDVEVRRMVVEAAREKMRPARLAEEFRPLLSHLREYCFWSPSPSSPRQERFQQLELF